jgi:hypothetical protein
MWLSQRPVLMWCVTPRNLLVLFSGLFRSLRRLRLDPLNDTVSSAGVAAKKVNACGIYK